MADTHPDTRYHFVDNLRTGAIALVIASHSLLAYATIISWWFVQDPRTSLTADALIAVNDCFLMGLLFFAAGFFAVPSYARRGFRDFIRAKLRRIGLPLLAGAIFLAPIGPYVGLYHRSVARGLTPETFGSFWLKTMASIPECSIGMIDRLRDPYQFAHSHLWFLSLLLWLLCGYALLARCQRALGAASRPHPARATPPRMALLVTGAVSAAGFFLVQLWLPDTRFVTVANLLMVRAPSLSVFVCFFCLGVYARHRRWFRSGALQINRRAWRVAALGLAAGYLVAGKWQLMVDTPPWWLLGFYSLARAYACVALCVVILDWASRRWNRSSALLDRLAASSYTIYILHLAPVLLLQALLVPLALPPLCKASLVFAGACATSFLISQHLRRNAPLTWTCLITGFCCLCLYVGG